MGTMAAKLTEVTVKRGKGTDVMRDPGLFTAIRGAYDIHKKLKALESGFSREKAFIAQRARDFLGQGGTVSFQAGGVLCRITERSEAVIPEENLGEIRRLLGRRFNELVRVRKSYTGTRALVDEADEEIKGLLVLRELSPQFKWEA